MMGKLNFKLICLQALFAVAALGFFSLTTVRAQSAVDIKTEFRQMELQGTQQVSPSPSQNTIQTQPKTINQNQKQNQVPDEQQSFNGLQNKIRALESNLMKNEDSRVNNWLNWWWQIGFWLGFYGFSLGFLLAGNGHILSSGVLAGLGHGGFGSRFSGLSPGLL